MGDHLNQLDTFIFSTEGSPTISSEIVIKSFKISKFSYVACLNLQKSTLYLYLCCSPVLTDRETKRFIVEIRADSAEFNASVQFTRNKPFCCFSGISAPFSIRTSLISQEYVNPLIPYVGINNMGVTCYIASAIQFLLTVTPFQSLILAQKADEGSLCKELQNIFVDYLAAFAPLQIRKFVNAFGGNSFEMTTREQDSHEFILLFFDKLDKNLGKDFEAARNEIFGVHGIRTIYSETVNVRSETKEFSNEIEIPIQNFKTLEESLSYLTESEHFTGEDQWDTGTEHGKQDAVRHLRYGQLPPFLMFHLCRYQYSEYDQCCNEDRSRIEFPETIDMKPYCTDETAQKQETNYRMISVIAHRGNLQSGHYISFSQPKIDGRWFQFNDANVTISHFDDIKSSFGGRNNTFTRMWSYISGGNFVAYVIGYVRVDCIDMFRRPPNVPLAIAPHLSNSSTCKLLYSDEIDGSKIYGYGKSINWDDDRKFDDIFERKDFSVFVALPHSDQLFGPIPRSACASNFTLKGYEMNFIGIPENIKEPIFFISDTDYVGVFNKDELFNDNKITNNYEFRYEGIPITDSSDLHSGSIIFGVPIKEIILKINKKELSLLPNTSYEAIQLIIAGNDKNKAPQYMFYSDNKPLRPRKYPTALALHMMGTIEARLLENPATAASLDMYLPLNIDLYDISHAKTTKKNVWFSKDSTVEELTKHLPAWFGYKQEKDYQYVVSYNQEHGILNIFDGSQKVTNVNIRIDIARCPFPKSTREIKRMLIDEESSFTAIEVRTMTYEEMWPKFRTMGIFVLTKSTTGNSIAKTLFKTSPVKILLSGTADFYKNYVIEGRDSLLSLLEQLTEMREWSNSRPIIVFQMNERKQTEMPMF